MTALTGATQIRAVISPISPEHRCVPALEDGDRGDVIRGENWLART